MRDKLKNIGYYFGIPFCLTVFYFLSCTIAGLFVKSNVAAMWVGDALSILVVGFAFYRLCVKPVPKENRKLYKFSGTSIFWLACLFIWQYIFSQATSSWVAEKYPSGYVSVYTKLADTDLYLYLLLAVTLGPIIEELLYRGIWYHFLRQKRGMLFCFYVSTILFVMMHGTTEHIPITASLSMFLCFVYEITGNIRYCMLIHILFNMIGVAYIVQIPLSYPFCITMFCIYVFIMFILFAGVDKLRDKMRYNPDSVTLTNRLEENRKHWGEKK